MTHGKTRTFLGVKVVVSPFLGLGMGAIIPLQQLCAGGVRFVARFQPNQIGGVVHKLNMH